MYDRKGVIVNNINNLGTGKKNTARNIGQEYQLTESKCRQQTCAK